MRRGQAFGVSCRRGSRRGEVLGKPFVCPRRAFMHVLTIIHVLRGSEAGVSTIIRLSRCLERGVFTIIRVLQWLDAGSVGDAAILTHLYSPAWETRFGQQNYSLDDTTSVLIMMGGAPPYRKLTRAEACEKGTI